MPNNRKSTLKKINGGKDGVHPGSRKAAQITRVHLRTAKLQSQTKKRKDLSSAKLFRPLFFLHALSGPQALSLPSLRALVADVFLTRNDPRISELLSERRAGRPKIKELIDLEELKRREMSEWETGFEVPDLTNPRTTRLMFSWIESGTSLQAAHVDVVPWIRLSRDAPEVVVVSRPGKLETMGLGEGVTGAGEDWTVLGNQDLKLGTSELATMVGDE